MIKMPEAVFDKVRFFQNDRCPWCGKSQAYTSQEESVVDPTRKHELVHCNHCGKEYYIEWSVTDVSPAPWEAKEFRIIEAYTNEDIPPGVGIETHILEKRKECVLIARRQEETDVYYGTRESCARKHYHDLLSHFIVQFGKESKEVELLDSVYSVEHDVLALLERAEIEETGYDHLCFALLEVIGDYACSFDGWFYEIEEVQKI